jgi:hypothetical protein
VPDAMCKCGAMAAHSADPTRCEKGHPLPGYPGPALKHGVHSFDNRGPAALPADLRGSVDAFRAQLIADRGGVEGLTAIEGGYVRRLTELETVARLLASDLAQRGLFTPRGRVRGTFNRWLESLDRWDRFAQRIGSEGRKPVLTLSERLAAITPTTDTED